MAQLATKRVYMSMCVKRRRERETGKVVVHGKGREGSVLCLCGDSASCSLRWFGKHLYLHACILHYTILYIYIYYGEVWKQSLTHSFS